MKIFVAAFALVIAAAGSAPSSGSRPTGRTTHPSWTTVSAQHTRMGPPRFPNETAASTTPCFAYLKAGDVWYRCGEHAGQVTSGSETLVFAVSRLALAIEDVKSQTRLYSLPSGLLIKTIHALTPDAEPELTLVCGKIYFRPRDTNDTDLGVRVAEPDGKPAPDIPCLHGLPPEAGKIGPPDLSENGRFVDYIYMPTKPTSLLCTGLVGGAQHCEDLAPYGISEETFQLSLTNTGDMFFVKPWGGTCWVSDNWIETPISQPPPPGVNGAHDGCTAIFIKTKTGIGGPLVKYATAPQALEPSEAQALAEAASAIQRGH